MKEIEIKSTTLKRGFGSLGMTSGKVTVHALGSSEGADLAA